LKTFALGLATGAIGLGSAQAKPAAAAVESELTPPGAMHLDALKMRLTQAPPPPRFRDRANDPE
jgi:hypothetical protein